ncbi:MULTISPECIES: ribonuclease R [unclassified Acinetobacter]|uniref:ribonuclease R n=1 Tax=unclassified Acinetobacter TaxID=196816 RepID=UPI0035BB1F3F
MSKSKQNGQAWNDPEALNEAQRYENPIPSRTLIASVVEKAEQGLSYNDAVAHFQLVDENDLEALRRRLNAMVRDGQLSRIGQNYRLSNDEQEFDAVVEINQKGFGFAVIADHEDFLLPERELRLVFNGDRIKVKSASVDRRGRIQGYISEVTQRQVKELIGIVAEHEEEFYVQPNGINQHQPITLEKQLVEHAGLKVGDHVHIAIDDYPTRDEFATGHVVQAMAEKADTEVIIPATILEYGLPYEFPEEVVAEAEKFKEPTARDRKDRIDLRDLPLVTIDGEDARDFDDAVYAEKRPGGGYRVVVAIADVSHYVKLGKPLDDEAQERGTSVYFPHFVLPMLPEALSNGLCSLNPHVDRLCMVCDLALSRAGKVTKYEFYPSVMHSKARLTYNQVADYLGGNSSALPQHEDANQQKAIEKSINTLNQLYHTLLELRQQRHAMEFETVETYMTFDDKGAIQTILPRTRNDAHRLIEECMLLANTASADYALKNEIPILYRVHEAPEFSRIQKVRDYVKLLGFSFPEQPTQADYQAIIDATKDRVDATSIHAVLLRSMMQAYYSPKNAGHYGLAYDAYTHFTSPIRRYPDLLLHRAIKAKLLEKPYPIDGQALEQAGEHFSQTERRADEASRSVTSWLKCHYMQQHLGEEFDGVITAVTDFGLFVTLSDLFVDGMLHISQLGEDYFVYDNGLQRLTGQNHGQIFALGDKVRIKVAGVSLEERKIDFVLVKQISSGGHAVREKAPRANSNDRQGKSRPSKNPSAERTQAVGESNQAKVANTPNSKPKAKSNAVQQQALATQQHVAEASSKKAKAQKSVTAQADTQSVHTKPNDEQAVTKPVSKTVEPSAEKRTVSAENTSDNVSKAEKKPKDKAKDKKSKSDKAKKGKDEKSKHDSKPKDKAKDKLKSKGKDEKAKKSQDKPKRKKSKKSNAKRRAED